MTQGAGNYASMAILAENAGRSSLFFGDSDAEQRGAFDYRHADDSLSISTAASEKIRITSAGNVGIGTDNPNLVTHIYFTGNNGLRVESTQNHSNIDVRSHNSYGAYLRFMDGNSRYWLVARSDDKLQFRPNATSLEAASIYFDETGKVGVGVSNPTEKLEVNPDTDVSAIIGKAHVGYMGTSDHARFSHVDFANSTQWAFSQTNGGSTQINTKSAGEITFHVNTIQKAKINSDGDFQVDTDTLYVDASADRVGINDSTPSHALDVNGIIRTQGDNKGGGLLGTQFTNIPCTTIDGFFASTSTEDYGYQNALVLNDLAGFTKWAGVTIATSGLYKARSGSAGSYTYGDEAGTGDFERAFQANNNTVGSWYTDSGPDGDITTGAANSGSIELYFNGVKSLNYSAQAVVIFGSNPFRATHVKIEALRTGGWQTIVDTTGNDKTAIIARIGGNGGGANATTGLRYTFAKAGSYFRINNFYAADYDLGNDLSYGGQYYIDKYYDGRHYSTLRPVVSGEADLGTNTVRYGDLYSTRGRITNKFGIGNDTLTYPLNVGGAEDTLAHFKSSDNKAGILIQDNDTAAYVSVENNILALGPQNGTNAAQNLNYNVTNYRLGIGTNVPSTMLHVEGTGTFHSVDITGTSTLTVSGKVGIGEVSPDKSLHIVGNDVNGELIKLEGDASYGATIQYGRSINYLWRAGVGGGSSTNSKIPTSYWGIEDVTSSNTPSIVCRPINQYVGVKNTNPQYELDVSGTIHGTSGNFENGITIDGNPVVTGTSAFESDTLQTVTDQGNITTNNIIIENNGNDPDYGALTISGGYALAHLRGTGTVAYLQFQNSTTSYGTMSNVGMTIGNNGHDAYVTNRQALGNLYLGTSGEARVAIKPDGDVGIGTLTPTENFMFTEAM